MKFSPDEETRLRQIHAEFMRKMRLRTPKQQRDHVMVNAAKGPGDDGYDPFYAALARQTQEGYEIEDRVKAAQAEITEIEKLDPRAYRPKDPDWYGRALTRKEKLERQIGADQARMIGLHEQGHQSAMERAVLEYRATAAKKAKNEAFKAALEDAEKEAEADALKERARSLVSASRRASGKDAA